MDEEVRTTTPKPFVFVLMPFDPAFKDIYEFGIKGAAQEVGAYAERIDEQIFTEGILERVFNQINKADVVVADMIGRNPNVFYEVGYAHALGKIVLLLTQRADDIPFDLKQHQHIIYGGSIETLKNQLVARIDWAINESKKVKKAIADPFEVTFDDVAIAESYPDSSLPEFKLPPTGLPRFIRVVVRNTSFAITEPVTHIYLYTVEDSAFSIKQYHGGAWSDLESFAAHRLDKDEGFARQFSLPNPLPGLPPGALEVFSIGVEGDRRPPITAETLRLQLHAGSETYKYHFGVTM